MMAGRADHTDDDGDVERKRHNQGSTVQSMQGWTRAGEDERKSRRRRSLVDNPAFVEQLAVVDAQPTLIDGAWADEDLDDPDRVFEPIWPAVTPHRGYFTMFEQATLILLGLLGAAAAAFLWHEELSRLL